MTLRKTVGTVGTLASEVASTAVNVARHPIGSTALAAGLVKGAAGAGLDLVRTTIGGAPAHPATQIPDSQTRDSQTPADEAPAATVPDEEPTVTAKASPQSEPERDLPGPDLAHFEPPRPEDLPEPIVIEADDLAADNNGTSGEAFHHEPKPANRDVAHGDHGFDFEEAEGFADEIPEALDRE